jgi:hypothetical protein
MPIPWRTFAEIQEGEHCKAAAASSEEVQLFPLAFTCGVRTGTELACWAGEAGSSAATGRVPLRRVPGKGNIRQPLDYLIIRHLLDIPGVSQ